jgi:hypothetical protein
MNSHNPEQLAALPGTSVIVTFGLSEADRDRLRMTAGKRGLSVSAFTRMLVLEKLSADKRSAAIDDRTGDQ